jgi:hypothetical protein
VIGNFTRSIRKFESLKSGLLGIFGDLFPILDLAEEFNRFFLKTKLEPDLFCIGS